MRYSFVLFCLVLIACGKTTTDESVIFLQKGNMQLQSKNYGEAARLFTEAIEKNSKFADAYLNRGLAKYYQGQLNEALVDYNSAIDLEPNYPEALFNRAQVKYELGDKSCIEDITRGVKLRPDSASYYLVYGNAKVLNGDFEGGLSSFNEAIRLNSSLDEAYVNRGFLYYRKLNLPSAKADFEKALSINPKQPFALNNLSLLQALLGDTGAALSTIEKALQIRPSEIVFQNNKALYLLLLGNLPAATDIIESALRRSPSNSYALRNKAVLEQLAGRYQNSINLLTQSLQLDSTTEFAYYFLGKNHQALKQTKEACEVWFKGQTMQDYWSQESLKEFCK